MFKNPFFIFPIAVLCAMLAITDTAPPGPYCEMLAKVTSESKTPFLFKIEMPHGQQVEELVFEEPGTQQVILKGYNCASAFWQLNTFQRGPDGTWQLAKATKAKVDGAGGEMEVKVDSTMQPRMGNRFKVSCAESIFCSIG